MEPISTRLTETQVHAKEQPSQEKLPPSHEAERTLEVKTDAIKRPTGNLIKPPLHQREGEKRATQNIEPKGVFHFHNALHKNKSIADQPTLELQRLTKHLEAEDSSIE